MIELLRKSRLTVGALFVVCLFVGSAAQAEKLIQIDFNDAHGNWSLVNAGTIAVTGTIVTAVEPSLSHPTVNRAGYSANFTNDTYNGANHITFGNLQAFQNAITNMTICLWLRPQLYKAYPMRVINKGSGGGTGWSFDVQGTYKPTLMVEGYNSASLLADGIPKGHWTFIAMTYNGTLTTNNILCYTGDGASLSIPTTNTLNRGSILGNSDELWFGSRGPGDDRPYHGCMDGVRIYDEVLDAAALDAIMKTDDAPRSGAEPPEVGKLVQMDFNAVLGGSTLDNKGAMLVDGQFGPDASYSTEAPAVHHGGYSASFDSTSSSGTNYISLAEGTEYNELNEIWQLTTCMWLRPGSNMTYSPRVISYLGSSSSQGWAMILSSYGTKLSFFANGISTGFLGTPLTSGQWEFVALTYDGHLTTNNLICYQGTSSTLTVTTNTFAKGMIRATSSDMKLWLGDRPLNGGYSFHGQMDNVRIYNSVLNLSDLETIMTYDDLPPKGSLILIQ